MPILTGEEARQLVNECFDRAEARMEVERRMKLTAPLPLISQSKVGEPDSWERIKGDFPMLFSGSNVDEQAHSQ
jgi:hypothetical protein